MRATTPWWSRQAPGAPPVPLPAGASVLLLLGATADMQVWLAAGREVRARPGGAATRPGPDGFTPLLDALLILAYAMEDTHATFGALTSTGVGTAALGPVLLSLPGTVTVASLRAAAGSLTGALDPAHRLRDALDPDLACGAALDPDGVLTREAWDDLDRRASDAVLRLHSRLTVPGPGAA